MARIRSRVVETESVNQRMLRRGAVKRQHIAPWAVGHNELAPGVVGDTHLHPTAIDRIREIAQGAPGSGEIVSVRSTDVAVPVGGALVDWAVLLGDREGFELLTLPADGVVASATGYYRATIALEWSDWFGGAVWVTVDEAQRFPPGVAPTWSADVDSYARLFEGSGEVLVEAGQRLGVFVDHGDTIAAHTLARVVAQFSLVETVGGAREPVVERVWNVRRQGDTGHTWSGKPAGWTDPDAWWVWKYALGDEDGPVSSEAVGGTMSAAAILNLTAATAVTIEATADNEFTLLLNGAQILVGNDLNTRYTASLTLPPGANRFDVAATNTDTEFSGPNPAGWLFSMKRDVDSVVILRSHEDDWFLA